MLTKTYNLQPITFPRIMLVDMNSFFASVEQQANPFLRGKPVGVVAANAAKMPFGTKGIFAHDASCLIATSKEAKKLGIKTGTLVYQAKKIYPKIILLQAEPEKYREVNRRIVKIFCDYTDRVEVYSIDEAFLDLNSNIEYRNSKQYQNSKHKIQNGLENSNLEHSNLFRASDFEFRISNPLLVAAEIKQRIKQEVGEWLTCSVGIGQNKFLCKLAADLQKPDGLSILWRENLPEIYKNKKLRDLWGISYGWEARLAKVGITSPLQLLGYPVQNLISLFGKPGFYLWQRVNGLEIDVINSNIEYRNSKQIQISNDQNSKRFEFNNSNLDIVSDFGFRASDFTQKSFGHSWVLNFRTTDKKRLEPVILRLAEKAARRMRREGFMAYGFYLSIRMVDGSYIAKSKKLKFAINTGLELYEQALTFLDCSAPIYGLKPMNRHATKSNSNFPADVMHIAVGFRELVKYSRQLEFDFVFSRELGFPSPSRGGIKGEVGKAFSATSPPTPLLVGEGSRALTATLDHLNNKYGEFTVRSGLLTNSTDYAPDAIAFGK